MTDSWKDNDSGSSEAEPMTPSLDVGAIPTRSAMEKLNYLRSMLKDYKRTSGKDPRRGHVVVVDVGGANMLLREVFFGKLPMGIVVSDETDELFQLDGIPVRLRYEVPYGSAIVVLDHQVPRRTCCDTTAMSTMLACMSRGSA